MHALTEQLQNYIQELDTIWQSLMVLLVSMLPVIELRGAIPIAAYAGMPWYLSYPVAVAGNILPVPFIILFVRPIFDWLSKHTPLGGLVARLERRAGKKIDQVRKYEALGLFIFVAIPLPGTGGWTGALIAVLMGMRLRSALPPIAAGVAAAGVVVTLISYGVAAVFGG